MSEPNRSLPRGWCETRLDEVCSTITDGTHKTPNYQQSGVRFISIANIRPFQPIDWDNYVKFITKEEHEELIRRCKPEFDDIVFPRIGTLGYAKRIDFREEVSLFVGLGLLKPNREVVRPKYLELWMNSPEIAAMSRRRATGTGRLTLALEQTRALPILLPPLPEQERIVAEVERQFTRLDAGVAAIKRVQAQLKRYRASVLKAACEGRLVPTEAELARREKRDYEPADKLLERILKERRARWEADQLAKLKAAGRSPKDDKWKAKYEEPNPPSPDALPTLPAGWSWTTLRTIAELKGGITKGQKRSPDERLVSVPYLRVANVQRGFLELSEMKEIEATDEEVADLKLVRGDILFNEGGDRDKLGRGWIWQEELPLCIHQNHVFRARLYSPDVEPKFVSHYANSLGQQYFIEEGKQTTNLASINLTKLGNLPVPLPPVQEQRRIVAEIDARLSVADAGMNAVSKNSRRAESLRRSVLTAAFRGLLARQDPSDEPASKLLERIRRAASSEPVPSKRPSKASAKKASP